MGVYGPLEFAEPVESGKGVGSQRGVWGHVCIGWGERQRHNEKSNIN